MKYSLRVTLIAVLLYLLFVPVSALAQIEWLNPEGRPGVQFEFTEGSFDRMGSGWSDFKYSFPTASMFMTLRGRFSRSTSGIFELSAFSSKYQYSDWYWNYGYRESRLGIANPYLGIELGKEGSSLLWNFGMRIPFISRDNSYMAYSSQYISSHRFLAFLNRVTQISSNWGYRYVSPSGSGQRISLGGQIGVPNTGDAEIFADLALNFWYRAGKVRLMTGLSSLCLLTESDIDFTDRLLTSVSFSADITMGRIEPGIHLQLPIGENLTQSMNNMYGVHIAYHFPTGERP